MIKQLEISVLKIKAKKLYIKYHNIHDGYSCGKQLTEYINPNLLRVKQEFNNIISKLKKLDPNCPDFNL